MVGEMRLGRGVVDGDVEGDRGGEVDPHNSVLVHSLRFSAERKAYYARQVIRTV